MTIHNAVVLPEIPDTAIGGGGVCSGCGCSPRQNRNGEGHEKIVATGWHIDYEGQVVFCQTCITFLGSLVGLVDPETGKARASDVRRAQRREAKIRAAAQALLSADEAAVEFRAALSSMAEALEA